MRLIATLLVTLVTASAVQAQTPPPNPCATDERFRQFDFWVGSWEVTNAQGNLAGENVVEQILSNCVVMENWTGSSGGTGKSFNYLDPASGRWHQLWVDGGGGHMRYEGEFRDGAMHFEGRNVYGNGQITLMQMTFTPMEDGRVRQFIQESRDEGETWNVWFDGYYARKTD